MNCKNNTNYLQTVNEINRDLINSLNYIHEKSYPQYNNKIIAINNNLHYSSMDTNPSDNNSFYQQGLNKSINKSSFGDYFMYVDNEAEQDIQFNEMEFENPLLTHRIEKMKDKGKEEKEEKEKKNSENELKCSDCKINKAISICSHCNKYYCEGCSNFINKYEILQNHILTKIPDNLLTVIDF